MRFTPRHEQTIEKYRAKNPIRSLVMTDEDILEYFYRENIKNGLYSDILYVNSNRFNGYE